MGTLFPAKMTLKDGYGFGGFSRAPPSKQTSEYPPPPPPPPGVAHSEVRTRTCTVELRLRRVPPYIMPHGGVCDCPARTISANENGIRRRVWYREKRDPPMEPYRRSHRAPYFTIRHRPHRALPKMMPDWSDVHVYMPSFVLYCIVLYCIVGFIFTWPLRRQAACKQATRGPNGFKSFPRD